MKIQTFIILSYEHLTGAVGGHVQTTFVIFIKSRENRTQRNRLYRVFNTDFGK